MAKKKRSVCLCATVATIALGLLFLILGLTVFKAKNPTTTVESISIADLDFSVDVAKLRVHLNVSLAMRLTVQNHNRVRFVHESSTAYLRYRGNDVGEVPIPAGRIGARSKHEMNVTLTLMADRLLSKGDFYSDALSRVLPLQTYVRIPGKVQLVIGIHVVAVSECDLSVDLASRRVANQTCHYKAKL